MEAEDVQLDMEPTCSTLTDEAEAATGSGSDKAAGAAAAVSKPGDGEVDVDFFKTTRLDRRAGFIYFDDLILHFKRLLDQGDNEELRKFESRHMELLKINAESGCEACESCQRSTSQLMADRSLIAEGDEQHRGVIQRFVVHLETSLKYYNEAKEQGRLSHWKSDQVTWYETPDGAAFPL